MPGTLGFVMGKLAMLGFRFHVFSIVLAVLAALVVPPSAVAQMVPAPPPLRHEREADPFANPGELPEEHRGAEVEQKLEAPMPLDATFLDEAGRQVQLGDYFDGELPVVVNFGFYECPMLCPMVWQRMAQAFDEMGWTPGREFRVVTISVSPTETPEQALEHKQRLIERFDDPEMAASGWHFLVGEADQIARAAEAVGFGYKPLAGEEGQFAHQAALVLTSPDGRVMRYMDGIAILPQTLRLSLVEASEGRVGSFMDRVFLFCSSFDTESNSYKLAMGMMRTGAALTVTGLVAAVLVMIRIGRRRRETMSITAIRHSAADPK